MSIIHVMQTVCGYVNVFSNIAADPQPIPLVGTPGLAQNLGGGGAKGVDEGGEGGLLGGIAAIAHLIPGVGTGVGPKDPATTPIPTAAKSTPSSNTGPATTPLATPAAAASPTSENPNKGGIFGWLTHWFMGTGDKGNDFHQTVSVRHDEYEGQHTRYQRDEQGERMGKDNDVGANRLVTKDGCIAKITRLQRRHNKAVTIQG